MQHFKGVVREFQHKLVSKLALLQRNCEHQPGSVSEGTSPQTQAAEMSLRREVNHCHLGNIRTDRAEHEALFHGALTLVGAGSGLCSRLLLEREEAHRSNDKRHTCTFANTLYDADLLSQRVHASVLYMFSLLLDPVRFVRDHDGQDRLD